MKRNLPAFMLYIGDLKKEAGYQALDLECKGAWLEILFLMHESERRGELLLNGQPMPKGVLAKLLQIPVEKAEEIVAKLLSYGVASQDPETRVIFNRRMVREQHLHTVRAEAGSKGGKQKASKAASKTVAGTATSSSSSSSSDSYSDTKQKKKEPAAAWESSLVWVRGFLETPEARIFSGVQLDDPIFWKNLLVACPLVNTADILKVEFAKMANWIHLHPADAPTLTNRSGKPNTSGIKNFIGRWIERANKELRKDGHGRTGRDATAGAVITGKQAAGEYAEGIKRSATIVNA